MSSAILFHKGDKFQPQGLAKFSKDILIQGLYTHPTTGQKVDLSDPARLHRLAHYTQQYRKNGNKIPFPDGHSFDAMKNLGDWDDVFIVKDGRLYGTVNPKAPGVEQRLVAGSIDAVSAFIEFNVKDSKGNVYPEVMTHICATDYPVVTGQKGFVPLARVGEKDVPIYLVVERKPAGASKALERLKRLFLSSGEQAAEKEIEVERRERPWNLSVDDVLEFKEWVKHTPSELARQGANLARRLEGRPPIAASSRLTETTEERLRREGAELARQLQGGK